MFKLGLIVNPIAGIGGKVGLKGSDGEAICQKALTLGAQPESNEKAKVTLQIIKQVEQDLDIYSCPGDMGEDSLKACGLRATILGRVVPGHSSSNDTVQAARDMLDAGVQLILFAGGDGTARNILDAVGTKISVLGIPAGCKIHSAVYALNPRRAGELVLQMAKGMVKACREAEVMDIDEELFRQNKVQARLYGYLKVPNERNLVQNLKSGRGVSESASVDQMAGYVAGMMEKDTLYIIGPGSTTRAIMDKLSLPNTLLGVDLVHNGELIAGDATEKDILCALDQYTKGHIIVTVIGGQGYVFGRGNQQISASVIQRVGKDNITIVASKDKMLSLVGQSLHVDTGVDTVNEMLCHYYKVVVGHGDHIMAMLTD